jgi:hypothetical protein
VTSKMLEGQEYLRWYGRLREDRIRRRLGFLRRDEGMMDEVDKVQLMLDRGEGVAPAPVTEESLRRRMRMPGKEPQAK